MKYLLPFFVILCFACGKDTDMLSQLPAPEEKTATSYLALGDSYTIGQSVPYELNYPNQLYEKLIADDIAIDPPTLCHWCL